MFLLHILDEQGNFELIDSEMRWLYPNLEEDNLVELTDKQYQTYCEKGNANTKFLNGEFVFEKVKKISKADLFAQVKADLLRQISAQTDRLQASLLAGYPESEIQSFYRQEREARAYLEDNTAPCEMLAQIARMRKIPLDFLAQKVVEKADQLAQATGQIIGTRQHFEDLIDQAKTEAELNQIKEGVAQWSI